MYLKLLMSIYLNLLYFTPLRTIGFMLASAVSQLALLVAIKLMLNFIMSEGDNNQPANELAYVIGVSLVFVLGQFFAKALMVSALGKVQLIFSLKTQRKKGSNFLVPFLVESRQLLLSIPRIIVALIVLVVVTNNLIIISYAPVIVAVYCYSAIKIEQKIRSGQPIPTWERLRIQNIYELVFAFIAIILCVGSIGTKEASLSIGDYAYLLIAFRVLISDLSNAGYSLPRQVRYVTNLPDWPKFFGSVRLWKER